MSYSNCNRAPPAQPGQPVTGVPVIIKFVPVLATASNSQQHFITTPTEAVLSAAAAGSHQVLHSAPGVAYHPAAIPVSFPAPAAAPAQTLIPPHHPAPAATRLAKSLRRYKTSLCKYFEDCNQCPYGSHCRFAHGAAELQNSRAELSYMALEQTYNRTAGTPVSNGRARSKSTSWTTGMYNMWSPTPGAAAAAAAAANINNNMNVSGSNGAVDAARGNSVYQRSRGGGTGQQVLGAVTAPEVVPAPLSDDHRLSSSVPERWSSGCVGGWSYSLRLYEELRAGGSPPDSDRPCYCGGGGGSTAGSGSTATEQMLSDLSTSGSWLTSSSGGGGGRSPARVARGGGGGSGAGAAAAALAELEDEMQTTPDVELEAGIARVTEQLTTNLEQL